MKSFFWAFSPTGLFMGGSKHFKNVKVYYQVNIKITFSIKQIKEKLVWIFLLLMKGNSFPEGEDKKVII